MKKAIYIFAAAYFILIVLQIIVVKKENPPVLNEPAWDSINTKESFMKACGDCHSNETKWPWYSNVPPFSFLISYDVAEGREHFNISEYRKDDGIKSAHEYEQGEMPLRIYTFLHGEAVFEGQTKTEFMKGLENTFGKYTKKKFDQNLYNHPEE